MCGNQIKEEKVAPWRKSYRFVAAPRSMKEIAVILRLAIADKIRFW
jgi:hypothetical protein